MNLRRPLVVLVSGLFVLVVAFAVLSGASNLSATIGDRVGALWLWRFAVGCLLLLVVDGFLLLAILGWNALEETRYDPRDRMRNEPRDLSEQRDETRELE
jgi:hypothetical protein